MSIVRRQAGLRKNVVMLAAKPEYFAFVNDKEERKDASLQRNLQQIRALHTTPKSQSVVLVCIGVAGAAFGASMVLDSVAKRRAEQAAAAAAEGTSENAEKSQDAAGATGGGVFGTLFNNILGAKTFYQGGFEEKMTKREAALILGVRESASRERIREAHRYMSRANHPDTGGSEYLAMKINEAKDLLLGSK